MFIPLIMKEKHMPLHLWRISKTENRGIKKLTLHHSYLSKWQNSKSSEFLNISFTNVVDYDTTNRKYYYFHFKVFFCSVTTLDDLRLAINGKRNFSYLCNKFPCGQNHTNLCWNPAINLISRYLQNINLKIFDVACCHKHAENLLTKSAWMLT